MLDACCGTGQLTRFLLDKGLEVEGFDIDEELVETCRLLYPGSPFYTYDFSGGLSEKRWDLIVSNPPFEGMKTFLPWLESALTPQGHAILIAPTGFMEKRHPAPLAQVLQRMECRYRDDIRGDFAHTRIGSEILILGIAPRHGQPTQPSVNTGVKDIPLQPVKTFLTPSAAMEKETEKETVVGVDIHEIDLNAENSRKRFDQSALEELAASIRTYGLLHPITLIKTDSGYRVVNGERRLRAYRLNGESRIPAIIREYTAGQVLEVNLVENINRCDLSPIEESDAFQKLLDAGTRDIGELSLRTGKSEGYIRSRLRLRNLTAEFRLLLEQQAISLAVAMDTAKYSQKLQQQIYSEHFVGADENSWKHLGYKEYAARVERLYTNDLSTFNFDKTACAQCWFNSALYDLFPGGAGRCMDNNCLQEKKNRFTVNFCKAIGGEYPNMEICISPHDRIESHIGAGLEQAGIEVKVQEVEFFPEKPQEPVADTYETTQAYEEAYAEFRADEMSYYNDLEEIQEKIKTGRYKKVVYIGDNNPVVGYTRAEEQTGISQEELLQKQDRENQLSAAKNAAKEAFALLRSQPVPQSPLSLFEEELMMYVLLDGVDRKYDPLLGIDGKGQKALNEEEKFRLMKSMTAEQKALVYRSFLLRGMSGPAATGQKAMLLVELSRQHHPGQTAEIVRRHTDNYNRKFLRIQKQLEAILQEKEKEKEKDKKKEQGDGRQEQKQPETVSAD